MAGFEASGGSGEKLGGLAAGQVRHHASYDRGDNTGAGNFAVSGASRPRIHEVRDRAGAFCIYRLPGRRKVLAQRVGHTAGRRHSSNGATSNCSGLSDQRLAQPVTSNKSKRRREWVSRRLL